MKNDGICLDQGREKSLSAGRASVGDEPVGKLICEQIDPVFAACRSELWLQYADKDAYLAGEKELLDLLKTSDGNDTVIIYLGRERAKKVLPRQLECAGRRAELSHIGICIRYLVKKMSESYKKVLKVFGK